MRRAVTLLVALVATSFSIPAGASATRGSFRGEVSVFAASSLTDAFTDIASRFERKYPGSDVTLSFGSSATLVTQVEQGAPADVIATADEETMQRLVDGGQVGAYRVFARNRLAIAVQPGNPERVRSLAETLDKEIITVLCAPEVPCGKLAAAAYERAGLDPPVGPTGANAKDTLAKVQLGEADAAIVYLTDVKAADDLDFVRIPNEENVIARYPIAPVAEGRRAGAKAFIQLVDSALGRRILKRHGFLLP